MVYYKFKSGSSVFEIDLFQKTLGVLSNLINKISNSEIYLAWTTSENMVSPYTSFFTQSLSFSSSKFSIDPCTRFN